MTDPSIHAANANYGTQTFNGNTYITYNVYQNVSGTTVPASQPLLSSVFLSYARADDGTDYDDPEKSLLRRLSNDLAQAGFAVWWDRISLPSRSVEFTKEIEDAIRASDRFVFIAAPGAAASEWVQRELAFALSLCKPITVLLRAGDYDIIPPQVERVNAIDMRATRAYAARLADLIARLRQDAPLGMLRGVAPLPQVHMQRPKPFEDARAALCADAIAPTVISIRATALYGLGGVGKSTLAAALAHDCQIRRTFRDGVIWLTVGQTPTPSDLQAAIGATMFDDDRAKYGNPQEGRLALARILEHKAALIVLDDVWDADIVRQFPIEETACRLLITTRSSAIADEVEGVDIPLNVLTDDEGIALLAQWASSGTADPDYRTIVKILGGHTLALVLAARQLQKKYAKTPADLLRLLTKGDSPFAHLRLSKLDKDRNVELSLSLSYGTLDAEEARRFRALGVIALDSTFDADLLAVLWGDAVTDTSLAPLHTLLEAGLLEAADEDGQYRQHRLLRAYARALLTADEREAAFGRYADHVTAQAEQFITLPPQDWGVLDSLLPHVEAVGESLTDSWLAAGDAPSEALVARGNDFANNVTKYVLRRPQMVDTARGRELRGLRWLEMGLALSARAGDQERESLFANQLGLAWDALGEKRKAIGYYERGLESYRALGDQSAEATMLNNIGHAWSDLGELRKALEFYEQALPLMRAVGDGGEAATLNNIGAVWHALREPRKALDFYEQALPLDRAVGDRGGEATTLNNIGRVWDALGEKRKALAFYEQALLLLRAVGDRGGEAVTLANIGGVWSALGEKRKALVFYEQALPLIRAVGDRSGEATMCANIGVIYAELGDLDQAIAYLERCVQLYIEVEHPSLAIARQYLERLKRQRDGVDAPADADPQAQVMQVLAQVYAQGGADAVRQMLQGQVDDAVIEQVITMLAAGGGG